MKKSKQAILCMLLMFVMVLMTACGNGTNNKGTTAHPSTLQPTTGTSTGGTGTGPTNGLGTETNRETVESTGVIDGLTGDLKNGVNNIKEGAKDIVNPSDGTVETTR